jgi:hypothetical protein
LKRVLSATFSMREAHQTWWSQPPWLSHCDWQLHTGCRRTPSSHIALHKSAGCDKCWGKHTRIYIIIMSSSHEAEIKGSDEPSTASSTCNWALSTESQRGRN